jgi:uncharacterized protein (TIGR03435 family)
MRRQIVIGSLVARVLFGQTGAQPAGEKLAFEVASVRLAAPLAAGEVTRRQGGPGTQDPERISYRNPVFSALLRQGFGLDFDTSQLSGPAWIDTQRVDISAKIPPGTTKEQLSVMLRNLLVERFRITFHYTKKDFPVYDLVVAKGGLKMTRSAASGDPLAGRGGGGAARRAGEPALDKDGFPVLEPGDGPVRRATTEDGRMTLAARAQTMHEIVLQLQTGFGDGPRIVDKTGLTGAYDYRLQYAWSPPPGAPAAILDRVASAPPAQDMVSAVESQLGLSLQKSMVHADMVVIDHIDKTPAEN